MMKLKRITEKVLITSLLFILCASFNVFADSIVEGYISFDIYDVPVINSSDISTTFQSISELGYPLGLGPDEFPEPVYNTTKYLWFDSDETIGMAYWPRYNPYDGRLNVSLCYYNELLDTVQVLGTARTLYDSNHSPNSNNYGRFANIVYFSDLGYYDVIYTEMNLTNNNTQFRTYRNNANYVPSEVPVISPGEGGSYGGIASESFPYESLYLDFLIPDDWDISSTSANGNLFDFLETAFNHVVMSMDTMLHMINYYVYVIQQDLNGIGTYGLWSLTPSQDGESYTRTVTQSSIGIRSVILNRIEYIADVFDFYFSRIYAWFYPLDSTSPFYWRYYNTATEQQESIGLAGLLYNISWYLGQLYTLTAQNAALDNMDEAIDDVTDTFTSVEQAEQAVVQSVTSSIQSFNPDVSELGAFRALSWCASYLQQIYVSLGAYGNVITIGLLLGVCSQLIGFVRYH